MKTTTALLVLPIAWLPSQAARVDRRALVAPASFADGWEYQGCYMYDPIDPAETFLR